MLFTIDFVIFENFVQSEWREKKFLRGSMIDNMRLSFRNKHQNIDLVFMQLAR